MARAKQPARGKAPEDPATEEAATQHEDETLAQTESEAPIAAEAAAEIVAPVALENEAASVDEAASEGEIHVAVEAAAAEFEMEPVVADSREIVEAQLPSVTQSATGHPTSFATIAAEMTDYSKRSVENASSFVRKLLGARSFESAIHIQSEYARSSYADLSAYLTKLGEIYAKLAKEAFERRSHVA